MAVQAMVRRQIFTVIAIFWGAVSFLNGTVIRSGVLEAVLTLLVVPPCLVCVVSSFRFLGRARRQAATLVATRPDAAVPVLDPDRFDEWAASNRYSRARKG